MSERERKPRQPEPLMLVREVTFEYHLGSHRLRQVTSTANFVSACWKRGATEEFNETKTILQSRAHQSVCEFKPPSHHMEYYKIGKTSGNTSPLHIVCM